MKQLLLCLIFFSSMELSAQNEPWKRPLKICTSHDGVNFSSIQTFQDSSGVPSMIKLPNGNLACVFQWFRQPVGSPSWDRVAVKFSSNNGVNWTEPQPIVVNNLPPNFTRPFDPTLAISDSGRIRIYFSDGLNMILDTSINTYSAISDDGIHYDLESGFRFSLPDRPVIDPAVIKFRNLWHLENPMSTGGYHNISGDGINFTRVPDIVSDPNHNWTGNYMIKEDTTELRFYGSGMMIWYSASSNGGVWSGFTNTNIQGGDPTVLKLSDTNYVMVYTGQPYPNEIENNSNLINNFFLEQNYPNPFNPVTNLGFGISELGFISLKVYNYLGQEIVTLVNENKSHGNFKVEFDGNNLPSGIYFYSLSVDGIIFDTKNMVLMK